jgi:hypothetical protein
MTETDEELERVEVLFRNQIDRVPINVSHMQAWQLYRM